MGFIKRIFQLSLTKKEVVKSKRFMAVLMIPVFVFQMSSLNLLLLQTAIAEDGESGAATIIEETEEAPAEKEPALEEVKKDDPPKEDLEPVKVETKKIEVKEIKNEEESSEVVIEKETPNVINEIVSESIPEIIDEIKKETPPVLIPEKVEEKIEKTKENDEGGKITPEAAYDENLQAPTQIPVVEIPKTEESWGENADGSSFVKVKAGNEYTYKDSGLKIKFTRVDSGIGEINIKEIKLSQKQIKSLGALSKTAWEITSDMENGTFEYELTLSMEENVDESKVQLVYAEKEADLNDENKIKTVEKEDIKVDNEKKELKAKGLDHFTVFVVSKSDVLLSKSVSLEVETIDSGCIEDAAGESLNCTANDISLANVTKIEILDDGCSSPDDTVTFKAEWDVQSTATERYDVGLYFSNDGDPNNDGSLSGSCSVSILPNSPVPPWFNFDGDICGDASSSAVVNPEIEMTVKCLDNNADNALDLPYCTSWDNQAGGICLSPLDAVPSQKSKCNCDDGFQVPITVPYKAQIEVVKDLIPSSDEGKFNLQIDGTDEAINVGDGGITGKVIVGAGTSENPGDTHTVSESAYSGTNISDYTSNISCVDRGTNTFDGGSPLIVSGTGPLSVPVQKDDDVVCTATNSINKATITINKIVKNDNGGNAVTSDFQAKLDGNNISWSTPTDVLPGTYTVSETNLPGYVATFSGDCDSSGLITVNSQENKTCTITNDDQPGTLIVKKEITNDNGGDNVCKDFSFNYGAGAINFEEDCQNEISVPAGIYNVTETFAAGYATTYDNCSNVVVPNGGSATCTIKNDDLAPSLTVVKKVVNDNGGNETVDAFEIKMNDGALSFGVGVPSGDITTYTANPTVSANTSYTLSEKDLPGYTEGDWVCRDVTGAPITHPLNLTEGQNVICEITNDDIAPSITLVKDVVNNNGGQAGPNDFGLSIGSMPVTSGQVYPVEANNSYVLEEDGLNGYEFVSITGDAKCPTALGGTVVLNEGENIICTIKNDDQPGKLTVIKIVDNQYGGNLKSEDFTINVSGVNPSPASFAGSSAGTIVTLDAGAYNVTENLIDGYIPKYSSDCTGTIALGENKTCTITNEDQAPQLTLVKRVVNDNGGTKEVADFPLFVGDVEVTSTVATTLQSNIEYVVSETSLPGYEASAWSGDCSPDGKITLKPGENKTCYITNDDIGPKLTVTKIVNNSTYGDLAVGDFPLYVNQTPVISGVQNGFDAGSYIVSETGKPGYSALISGDCDVNGNVILNPGDVKSCTITNTDNLGKIIIEKQTLPNGDPQLFTFSGEVSGQIADGGTLEKIVAPGAYSVSETVPSGWDLTNLVCDDSNLNSGVGATANINVENNETVKCTFTNTKRGSITIIKDAINNDAQDFEFTNNFGNDNPTNFYLDDDSNGALPKTKTFGVLPGEYWVSEKEEPGWQQESATCDNGETIESINVEPGENIICEFVNEKYAKIILVKNTIGGDGDFDFDITVDNLPLEDIKLTTINSTASQTFSDLDQDNEYSIKENVLDGWILTSAICTGGNTPEKITPDPGETVTCTFTNTKKSNLTVIKKVINDNGGNETVDAFGINFSGGDLTFDAGVPSGSTTTYTAQTLTVDPGSYNLSENDIAGYTEGAWDCGAVGAGGISTAVNLAPGENKICTIVNDDIAPTVTLIKEVTGGVASPNSFGLTIGDLSVNSGVATEVKANETIALDEDGLDGYTFTSITGEGCPTALGGTVILSEGENITCTITNTRDLGSITVNKIIDMDGDLQTTEDQTKGVGWQFDADGTAGETSDPLADFTKTEGNLSFTNLKTGEYTIIETKQPGYDLFSADCGSENGIFDGMDSVDNVLVSKDGNTICNFYNVPNGTIHGYKWEDLDASGGPMAGADEELLSGWTINLYRGIGDGMFETEPFKTMQTSDGEEHLGWYWFEHLLPGEYKVCEALQDGWTQTYPSGDGGNCHIVNLPDDNSNGFNESRNAVWGPEYNFGNFELGKIKACKYEDINGNGHKDAEDFPLANIDIQLFDYPDSWELYQTKSTGEDGCVIFDNLTAGKYKVEEDINDPDLSGYYQSLSPQSFEYEIFSGSDFTGEEEKAEFFNSKLRTISGYKFSDLNGNGVWEELEGETPLAGWTIYLDNNFNEIYDLGETSTITDANGYYEFNGLFSDSYRVAEFLSPIQAADGWVQTAPSGGYYDLDLRPVIISAGNNFGNVELTDVHGYKWDDLNNNGVRDCIEEDEGEEFRTDQICELEPLLPGWRVFIDENGNKKLDEGERNILTSSDDDPQHFGWYWFEHLLPGEYSICEEMQEGWDQTYPGSFEEALCHTVILPDDCEEYEEDGFAARVATPNYVQTYCEFDFGNQFIEPELTILKYNNQWPTVQSPGSIIDYTIKVEALENNVNDVKVIDLPPEGFKYLSGSWSATSSLGGGHSGALELSHEYASPGEWSLGDMQA
ncbi:MAG: hypothetical protein V3574_03705, partial [Candidatus Moraniibacteriota bacterium]